MMSGGGLRGMDVLTGQLLALADVGITPTAVCGTSAGAAIAALLAAGHDAKAIYDIISGLRDCDIRAERWFWKPRALWIDHFLDNAPIRHLLQRHLPANINALVMPLACATTRVTDGASVVWTSSSAIPGRQMRDAPDWRECILASTSISGVFPWVCIIPAEAVQYADGGVRANLPLPPNWTLFDAVYLLIAGYQNNFSAAGNNMLSRLILNTSWYALDQIDDVLARIYAHPAKKIHTTALFPPKTASTGSSFRFDHSLIASARSLAQKTLTSSQKSPNTP